LKEILVELERNRVRLVVRHDEDETILKLNLQEAQTLSDDLKQALEDYQQRKHIRID
jgi:hypothetical protein